MKLKRLKAWLATAAAAAWGLSLLHAQSAGGFRFRGLLNRFVAPSNAVSNRAAVFCFDNPSDSGISLKIFSLSGAQVASPSLGTGTPVVAGTACPLDSPLPATGPRYGTWDGTSNGSIVRSGIYVYQVQAEGLTFTGALVVVR